MGGAHLITPESWTYALPSLAAMGGNHEAPKVRAALSLRSATLFLLDTVAAISTCRTDSPDATVLFL